MDAVSFFQIDAAFLFAPKKTVIFLNNKSMAEQQQAFATPHVTPLKIQLNDKQQTPPSAHEKTNRSQSTSFSTARFAVKKTKLPLNLETLQQHQLGPAGTKISQRKNEIDKLITSVLTSPKTQDAASFRSHASIISGKKLFGDQTTGILSTKAKLCVESLSEGCIDAFVLLFDLIHKPKVWKHVFSIIYF